MTTWVMHCHHYIKSSKPRHEVETRLRLLRVLTEEEAALLPKAYAKTRAAYNKAGAAYDRAWAAYEKAEADAKPEMEASYEKAEADAKPELEALHARLCMPDCPWDSEKGTLFPAVS